MSKTGAGYRSWSGTEESVRAKILRGSSSTETSWLYLKSSVHCHLICKERRDEKQKQPRETPVKPISCDQLLNSVCVSSWPHVLLLTWKQTRKLNAFHFCGFHTITMMTSNSNLRFSALLRQNSRKNVHVVPSISRFYLINLSVDCQLSKPLEVWWRWKKFTYSQSRCILTVCLKGDQQEFYRWTYKSYLCGI